MRYQGHFVTDFDVGGDAAVQQAGYLDQVEIDEEVNVLNARELGNSQALQTQLLVHVDVVCGLHR